MMIPEYILMDAVDDLAILDTWLGHFNYPESHVDKVLRAILVRLRYRSDALTYLDDYLEQLRMQDYSQEEMEFIGPAVAKLYTGLYYQLIDKKLYLPNGVLPYGYGGRGGRKQTKLLILAYEPE